MRALATGMALVLALAWAMSCATRTPDDEPTPERVTTCAEDCEFRRDECYERCTEEPDADGGYCSQSCADGLSACTALCP